MLLKCHLDIHKHTVVYTHTHTRSSISKGSKQKLTDFVDQVSIKFLVEQTQLRTMFRRVPFILLTDIITLMHRCPQLCLRI